MLLHVLEPDGNSVRTTVPLPFLTAFYEQFPPGTTLDEAPYGAFFIQSELIAAGPTTSACWDIPGGWKVCHMFRGQQWRISGFTSQAPGSVLRAGISEDGRFVHAWGDALLPLQCEAIPFVPDTAIQWLRCGDRGSSSEALCKGLFPGVPLPRQSALPRDAQDFRRCVSLLDLVDPLRDRLRNIVPMSPEWARLLKSWPEFEQLLVRDQFENLTLRIQALQDSRS